MTKQPKQQPLFGGGHGGGHGPALKSWNVAMGRNRAQFEDCNCIQLSGYGCRHSNIFGAGWHNNGSFPRGELLMGGRRYLREKR